MLLSSPPLFFFPTTPAQAAKESEVRALEGELEALNNELLLVRNRTTAAVDSAAELAARAETIRRDVGSLLDAGRAKLKEENARFEVSQPREGGVGC